MDIIKNNVIMRLDSEERQTLNEVCELLNQIADKLDKDNYHWLVCEKTGSEVYTEELRNIVDTIEMFTYDSDIEIY